MATVTYSWSNTVSAFFVNNLFAAGAQSSPAIDGLFRSYAVAWTDPGIPSSSVQGRFINSDGTPVGDEILLNSTTSDDQISPSLTSLIRGTVVVTFTDRSSDPSGDIRARLFSPSGTPAGADFLMDSAQASSYPDSQSDVAALADGGFVVTWRRNFGGNDDDLRAAIFNANGSERAPLIGVDANTATRTVEPSAAGLTGGDFVVAWSEEPVAAGDNEVWFRRFDASGTPLGGKVLIDAVGSINIDIQVVALRDGGFAVAYTDNGWNISGTEITLQIFNADGSARTGFIRPNIITLNNQFGATLTVLSNGFIVVGWSSGDDLIYQAYTPQGATVGPNALVVSSVIEAEIAGLAGGLVANVRSSSTPDAGGDQSIRSSVHELTRTITSDGSGEMLTGDSLRDFILGNGGDDILNGGASNDTLDGGAGIDTAVFAGPLAAHAIDWSGTAITLDSFVEGLDSVRGIEIFAFGDGNVLQNDGNAGVDDLFYYSRSPDVWNAHAEAEAHYDSFGWVEGRDPSAFFATIGYFSVNVDVRSAHVNPLAHYHTSGWREGRDASATFDTELYLLRNPDVAAAGIDPLEHFLAVGREEGRSAHAAVGRSIVGGFDPQFYLLANPDVGFAGVDPLAHYNASGWREGRDPNAFFDTSAYLAAYADVAAAGVDPLLHYHSVGWREGRDPSGAFDTNAYLLAYPDVAAANIDPLEHYLRSGIYEGRSAFGDGVFD